MKQEIKELFNLFEGDHTSFALFAYLATHFKANERQLISLRKISVKSGFSRVKVLKLLSRLKEMTLLSYEIRPGNGVSLVINLTTVRTNLTTVVTDLTTVRTNLTTVATNLTNLTNKKAWVESEASEDSFHGHKDLNLNLNLSSKTKSKLIPKTKSLTPAKKPRTKAKKINYHTEDFELGKKWHQYALAEMKWSTAPKSWNDEFFATSIALVKRRSGLDHNQMTKIYEFVKDDNFWSGNALSPKSLLNKSGNNDLRKLDNIISSIRSRNPAMKQLEKVVNSSEEEKAKADDTLMMLQNPEEYFRRNND